MMKNISNYQVTIFLEIGFLFNQSIHSSIERQVYQEKEIREKGGGLDGDIFSGVSNIYIHRSKQGVTQETYLNECIKKRLLPFITKYHSDGDCLFWPDLASAHYWNIVQEHLTEKNIRCVSYVDNPLNVPQARPIELLWSILERKIYENNWEARDIDHLAQRIRKKVKELDRQMLQNMVESVRKKLRALRRNGLYSIL